jgi:hypothetical protein
MPKGNRIIETILIDDVFEEPITLDDFKAFARITSIEDDNVVSGILTSARKFVETQCNISIGSQSRNVKFSHSGDRWMMLPSQPLISVDKVEFTNCDCMIFATAQTDTYHILGEQFARFKGLDGYYSIDYSCGYEDVPEGIKTLIKQIGLSMFEQRGDNQFVLPGWIKENLNTYSKKTWV